MKPHVAHAVDVWRRLRRPFILTPRHCQTHACEWEHVDTDVLGCLVCGDVHVCESRTCTDVVETNDGVVCVLSGVVIYDKKYSDNEYMDTMALTSNSSVVELQFHSDVELMVHTMLFSSKKKQLNRSCMCDLLLQWTREIHANCAESPCRLITGCAELMHASLQRQSRILDYISAEKQNELHKIAVEDCARTLYLMTSNGMQIKSHEVHRLTVGILYLMRCGVKNEHTVILQARPEIYRLLPPENTLLRNYSMHPKFITETENKLKFCLRSKIA